MYPVEVNISLSRCARQGAVAGAWTPPTAEGGFRSERPGTDRQITTVKDISICHNMQKRDMIEHYKE